ncbi:P-loop containing nucleoside triphosphate hydrolase protein [Chiua virens]|nr:P-loop containing nucleoside triphosphate hydrolase protein [Chiua virens]
MCKPDPERVYKVALFGVTGCGKSSIINLLADKPVANVSTGVEACTTRARWYPISIGDKKFRLWDTMGFNQAEVKGVNPLSPYEQAHTLLQNLEDGVDLVVLCARKDGITASLRNIYWLLDSFFFGGRAQIALVFTHFDTPPNDWWDRNKHTIAQRCNIPVQFVPHACITTVQDGPPQPASLYDQSKLALEAILEEYATPSTPTALHLDLSSDSALATAAESLKTYCQLNISYAITLSQKFRSPKRPFQAVFFGESGVGKSSTINLIVGKKVADVSNGVGGCTLDSRCHEINTGLHQFVVWDTVGFNEPHIEHSVCGKAIENAVRLVRDLHRRGGVDLLVFCKKGGRVTGSEVNNFRLFYEFLCPGQVPVAFVVTQLEHEIPMEGWWEKHGENLVKAFHLKMSAVAGHACITSLASANPDAALLEKLSLSRQTVQSMLEDTISYGSAFSWDEATWVMQFLRILVGMVRVGNPPRREKITIKNLMDRCGLSKEQADELVKLLYTRG